jgi:hypothetical protein
MRFLVLAVLAFVILPSAPRAQDASIPQVIENQLSAFQADDFSAAFDYASPTIKQLFGTAERFGQMVQSGYPMVHRPAEVNMLDQRTIGSSVVQRVMIRDGAGRLHFLDYQMVPSDGGWQMNGVQILQAPHVGA